MGEVQCRGAVERCIAKVVGREIDPADKGKPRSEPSQDDDGETRAEPLRALLIFRIRFLFHPRIGDSKFHYGILSQAGIGPPEQTADGTGDT